MKLRRSILGLLGAGVEVDWYCDARFTALDTPYAGLHCAHCLLLSSYIRGPGMITPIAAWGSGSS